MGREGTQPTEPHQPSQGKTFFFKDFMYLFLDRGEGREKVRERNINVCFPFVCPTPGNLAHNSGMCPDRESNQRPLGLQAGTQSTEPHQPGP